MEENNNIFADTNFFVALYNLKDSQHKKAVLKRKQIQQAKPKIFISNFVFLEVVTILSQRAGKILSLKVGKSIIQDQRIEIIQIDKELNDLTWKIFQTIKRKNLSFVDASIIACMQVEGINKLLTFDEEDFSNLRKKYRFSFF